MIVHVHHWITACLGAHGNYVQVHVIHTGSETRLHNQQL